MPGHIKVGTSGFRYADWTGPVYPKTLPGHRQLAYYAGLFDILELNATYYRYPQPEHLQNMVDVTEGELLFHVKIHRDFTHGTAPPPALSAFLERLEPLRQAHVLSGVLFQFPGSFRHSRRNAMRLQSLCAGLNGIHGTIEFRHTSWLRPEVMEWMTRHDLSICSVDQPDLNGLPGVYRAMTATPGYVRFHGRNAKTWWNHEKAWERYDYLYSAAELRDWVAAVRDMASDDRPVHVLFNNHYRGQAVKNAQMFMAFLAD